MDRYRSDGPSSLKRYGQRLNRCSGVRPVSLAIQGNRRIVSREEDLTRASGGVSSVPTKNVPPQGDCGQGCPCRRSFLPTPKGEGILKGIFGEERWTLQGMFTSKGGDITCSQKEAFMSQQQQRKPFNYLHKKKDKNKGSAAPPPQQNNQFRRHRPDVS